MIKKKFRLPRKIKKAYSNYVEYFHDGWFPMFDIKYKNLKWIGKAMKLFWKIDELFDRVRDVNDLNEYETWFLKGYYNYHFGKRRRRIRALINRQRRK